jgi:hypothetical protein
MLQEEKGLSSAMPEREDATAVLWMRHRTGHVYHALQTYPDQDSAISAMLRLTDSLARSRRGQESHFLVLPHGVTPPAAQEPLLIVRTTGDGKPGSPGE